MWGIPLQHKPSFHCCVPASAMLPAGIAETCLSVSSDVLCIFQPVLLNESQSIKVPKVPPNSSKLYSRSQLPQFQSALVPVIALDPLAQLQHPPNLLLLLPGAAVFQGAPGGWHGSINRQTNTSNASNFLDGSQDGTSLVLIFWLVFQKMSTINAALLDCQAIMLCSCFTERHVWIAPCCTKMIAKVQICS